MSTEVIPNSMSMDLYDDEGDNPHTEGLSESETVAYNVNRLLGKDLPQQLQKMLLANTELRDLAHHCSMQVTLSKGPLLNQTKVYAAQSLASIAYQINTLATDLNQLLESQTLQWQEMQHNLNNISQKIDYYNEKRSRHIIGKLTSEKPVHFMLRINGPAQKDQPMKYERRPLDFTLYDHIGHGNTTNVSSPIGTGSMNQSLPVHNEVRTTSISAAERRQMMAPTISIETESIYDTSFNVMRKGKRPIEHFIPRAGLKTTDTEGSAFSSSLLGQGNTMESLYDSLLSSGMGYSSELAPQDSRSPLSGGSIKEDFPTFNDPSIDFNTIETTLIMDPLEEIESLPSNLDLPPPLHSKPPPPILEPEDSYPEPFPPNIEPPPPNFLPPSPPVESEMTNDIKVQNEDMDDNLANDLYDTPDANIPLPPLDMPGVEKAMNNEFQNQDNNQREGVQRPLRSAPAPPPPQGISKYTRPLVAPPRPPTSAPLPPTILLPSPNDLPPPSPEPPTNIPDPPPDLPKDGVSFNSAVSTDKSSVSSTKGPTSSLKGSRMGGGGDIFSEMRAKQQAKNQRLDDSVFAPSVDVKKTMETAYEATPSDPVIPDNVDIPDPPPDMPLGGPIKSTSNTERRTSASRPPPKKAPRPSGFDPSQITQFSLKSIKKQTSTNSPNPSSVISPAHSVPVSAPNIAKETPKTTPPAPPPPPPDGDVHVPKDYLEKMETIYSYKGQNEDELSFGKNRIIYVLKKNPDDWYEGVLDGVRGLFPANYVKKID